MPLNFSGFSKIFVGSGFAPNGPTGKVEIIDLSSPSSHCMDLPDYVNRTYGSVGGLIHQDYPLICSGIAEQNKCYSYMNGAWKVASSMAENRTYAAAAPSPFPEDPFSLIIIGGNTNSSIYLSDEIWVGSFPDFPLLNINKHCTVKINSTAIMVIGGAHNNGRYSNRTYILDTRKNTWEEGPNLLLGRSDLTCAKIRSDKNSSDFSIVVAGGWIGRTISSTEILDDLTGNWRSGPELPSKMSNCLMVEDSEGGVVIVGGEVDTEDGIVLRLDTLFHLNHAGQDGAWVQLPQKLKTPRSRIVAFMVPDSLTSCN